MAISGNNAADMPNRNFVATLMAQPLLERDHEFDLARAWRDDGDEAALHELVTAYGRYVVRMAWKFRGYGLPINDLVQEGNIGLMEAAARFDPDREARFSTYASWWIMAAIQDHILRNTSIVRVATTPAQRRLFFNLRRLRAKIAGRRNGELTGDDYQDIADDLRVKLQDVERMEVHLGHPDHSLNAPIGTEDDGSEQMDFLPDSAASPEDQTARSHDRKATGRIIEQALDELSDRERQIIVRRFLKEDKATLSDIGDDLGVSKERIRQLEARALQKLRHTLAPQIAPDDIADLVA